VDKISDLSLLHRLALDEVTVVSEVNAASVSMKQTNNRVDINN
jgi:hypothetical protein